MRFTRLTRILHNCLSGRLLDSHLSLEFLSTSFPRVPDSVTGSVNLDSQTVDEVRELFAGAWKMLFVLMKKNSELQNFRFECQEGINFDAFLEEIRADVSRAQPRIKWRYLLIFSEDQMAANVSEEIRDSCKFFELVFLNCINFHNKLFDFGASDGHVQKKIQSPLCLSEVSADTLPELPEDEASNCVAKGMYPDSSFSGQSNLVTNISYIEDLLLQIVLSRTRPIEAVIAHSHRVSVDSVSNPLTRYIYIFRDNLQCGILDSSSEFRKALESSVFMRQGEDYFKLKRYLQIVVKSFTQSAHKKDSKLAKYCKKRVGIDSIEHTQSGVGFGELRLSHVPLLLEYFELSRFDYILKTMIDPALFPDSAVRSEEVKESELLNKREQESPEEGSKKVTLKIENIGFTSKLEQYADELVKVQKYNKKSKNLLLKILKLMVVRFIASGQYKTYFLMTSNQENKEQKPENIPICEFLKNFASDLVEFNLQSDRKLEIKAVNYLNKGIKYLRMRLRDCVWLIKELEKKDHKTQQI